MGKNISLFYCIIAVKCEIILNIILNTNIVLLLMQLYSFRVLHTKEHSRIKRVLC